MLHLGELLGTVCALLAAIELTLVVEEALEVGPDVDHLALVDDLAGLTVAVGLGADPAAGRLVARLAAPRAPAALLEGVHGICQGIPEVLGPVFLADAVEVQVRELRQDRVLGGLCGAGLLLRRRLLRHLQLVLELLALGRDRIDGLVGGLEDPFDLVDGSDELRIAIGGTVEQLEGRGDLLNLGVLHELRLCVCVWVLITLAAAKARSYQYWS